jgi:hypothetical protein
MQYVDRIHEHGTALFQRVCEMDLEGIVAKQSYGPYVTERERTTWAKIKNKNYSQSLGREKLFDRKRQSLYRAGIHAISRVRSWSCELPKHFRLQ